MQKVAALGTAPVLCPVLCVRHTLTALPTLPPGPDPLLHHGGPLAELLAAPRVAIPAVPPLQCRASKAICNASLVSAPDCLHALLALIIVLSTVLILRHGWLG